MLRLEKQREKTAKRLARKANSKLKSPDLDPFTEQSGELTEQSAEAEPKAEDPTL